MKTLPCRSNMLLVTQGPISRGSVRCLVAVNIAIVGLSLYGSGFSGVGNCVQVSICKPMLNFCCLSLDYYCYNAMIVDSCVYLQQ